MEALRMKDEQLKILSEQNSQLLHSLNEMDDQINALKMAKIAIEGENRTLRDQNFEMQSKTRAATAQLQKFEVRGCFASPTIPLPMA